MSERLQSVKSNIRTTVPDEPVFEIVLLSFTLTEVGAISIFDKSVFNPVAQLSCSKIQTDYVIVVCLLIVFYYNNNAFDASNHGPEQNHNKHA